MVSFSEIKWHGCVNRTTEISENFGVVLEKNKVEDLAIWRTVQTLRILFLKTIKPLMLKIWYSHTNLPLYYTIKESWHFEVKVLSISLSKTYLYNEEI